MANGWTPERRARQAALIQIWKPWKQSTGPRSDNGKSISSMNARTHGLRSKEWRIAESEFREYFLQCRELSDDLKT